MPFPFSFYIYIYIYLFIVKKKKFSWRREEGTGDRWGQSSSSYWRGRRLDLKYSSWRVLGQRVREAEFGNYVFLLLTRKRRWRRNSKIIIFFNRNCFLKKLIQLEKYIIWFNFIKKIKSMYFLGRYRGCTSTWKFHVDRKA